MIHVHNVIKLYENVIKLYENIIKLYENMDKKLRMIYVHRFKGKSKIRKFKN